MSLTATKTATFVRDVSADFNGHAAHYSLSEPIVETSWEGEVRGEYSDVIVSAVSTYAYETLIFPATKDGKIVNFGDLDGSMRGTLDHADALSNAGYVLA